MKIAFKLAVVVLLASCSTLVFAAEEEKLERATPNASVEIEETEARPATLEEEGASGMQELDLQAPQRELKANPKCSTIHGVGCGSITNICRCDLVPGEATICFCDYDEFDNLVWQCLGMW